MLSALWRGFLHLCNNCEVGVPILRVWPVRLREDKVLYPRSRSSEEVQHGFSLASPIPEPSLHGPLATATGFCVEPASFESAFMSVIAFDPHGSVRGRRWRLSLEMNSDYKCICSVSIKSNSLLAFVALRNEVNDLLFPPNNLVWFQRLWCDCIQIAERVGVLPIGIAVIVLTDLIPFRSPSPVAVSGNTVTRSRCRGGRLYLQTLITGWQE